MSRRIFATWFVATLTAALLASAGATAQKIIDSLAPGGMVVVEGFHRDTTAKRPVGGGVVFDTNELLKLFAPLRVIQYEDLEGPTDFGIGEPNRLVRLAAIK